MKKILLLLALLFASSTITFSQQNPTELNFDKNRARYIREQFSEGEDASSGFDYVYFRSGESIVMIRSIWSATHTRELRIEDMYFDANGLAMYRRSTARKSSMATLKTGRNTGLATKEEMHYEEGKLARWMQDGRPVDRSGAGPMWLDTEQSTLKSAKAWIESYDDFKKGNQ